MVEKTSDNITSDTDTMPDLINPTCLTYTARYHAPAEWMTDLSKLFATSATKTNQTLYNVFQAPFQNKQISTQINLKDGSHAVGGEPIFT
jgi:hypothetical protein